MFKYTVNKLYIIPIWEQSDHTSLTIDKGPAFSVRQTYIISLMDVF